MMIYRATPLPHNGLSPSQMLFDRQIKTTLPQAPQKLLLSHINYKVLQNRQKTYRASAKQNNDRKRRAFIKRRGRSTCQRHEYKR
jgi:hypothetical protein